jgi:hypothetical protein
MSKKLLTIAALICCGGAHLSATEWQLIASYPTPGPNPRGYSSWHPYAGYIVMDGPTPYVYFYSWEWSSILSSFPAPGGPGTWGISYTSSFFISNNRTSWIYEAIGQGSVINSFRCPFDGPADVGIKFHFPAGLLVAIPDRNIIALLERTTGSLIRTYAGPGRRPVGTCGYAHHYIVDAATHIVYEDGVSILTGIQTPVGLGHGWYMEPPYDTDIYIIDDATDRYYFYQRPPEGMEPASLGRVKALFK